MTEEEKKLFRLYGKLPTHKNVLTKMQKVLVQSTIPQQNMVLTAVPAHWPSRIVNTSIPVITRCPKQV
jgi:hypothetical protein